MKILGLDNKEYKWNLSSAKRKDKDKSNLHKAAREIIKEIFPYDIVHEEVSLPGTKTNKRKSLLYADFFIPCRMLLIEVNGEQHTKFVPFFHSDKYSYYKSIARDSDKKEWCRLNNITLIELAYNEKDQWKDQILMR